MSSSSKVVAKSQVNQQPRQKGVRKESAQQQPHQQQHPQPSRESDAEEFLTDYLASLDTNDAVAAAASAAAIDKPQQQNQAQRSGPFFWNRSSSINSNRSTSPPSLARLTPKQRFGNKQHLISSDTLIARVVNQLTAREREKIMLEIHGIADTLVETPELVQQSLLELNTELLRIRNAAATFFSSSSSSSPLKFPSSTGGGVIDLGPYEAALRQNANWVQSREVGIRFLRAERFVPLRAAERMLRYFEEKQFLFGPDALCKPKILLSDMSPDAIQILELGAWQLLPGRDQGGRAIIFCAGKLIRFRTDPKEVLAALQAWWKISEITTEDEETQKRGCVILIYNLAAGPNSGDELRGLQRIGRAFPQRTASLHACVDDATTKMVIELSILMTGKDESTRYRCHSGSDIEVQYALNTFGIPNRILPVNTDGSVDVTQFLEFLKQLRIREEIEVAKGSTRPGLDEDGTFDQQTNAVASLTFAQGKTKCSPPDVIATSKPYVVVPGELDVLLGRGRAIQEHTGNMRCRQLVASFRDRYDRGSKSEKTEVVRLVVDGVHEWGGRFLDRNTDGGVWNPVTDEHARYKISHGFRNHKRLTAQKQNSGIENAAFGGAFGDGGGGGRKSPS